MLNNFKEFSKMYLRRSPLIYSLVDRFRFYFSPLRVLRIITNRIFHPKHRRNSTVLAGPKYLGYKGGVYNPGALPFGKRGVLLLAKAQQCHWLDAKGLHVDQYFKGDPVMFVLNEDLNIHRSRIVRMDKSFPVIGKVGYEDFRLFRHRGEVWVNHGMISIQKQHNCASNFNAATPCLSRLDTDNEILYLLGHPQVDFEVGTIEKNWLFFEHDGYLYLLYSMNPYRLLKLKDVENLKFETVLHENIRSELRDIGGFGTMVSFSTNPIDYDETHYIFLVHQVEHRGIERYYHHWGILLDKETLLPVKITAEPLFSGMGARGRKPGIVYVSSLIKRDHDFVFFMGEGDAYITHSIHSTEMMESLWKSL